ncbi:MAG: STAS/SEC14 domain-containing protein [Thermodesulfobacteriales bacterium]|nr:MAG: STAS/SEC14 domain-containing protein [Thermodesulfobacteriales bacterium]
MLELIEGLPENALGFSAKGNVSAKDYETVLIPAVEEKLKHHDKVRLLYHLGDEFEKFEVGAMWDDAKVGLAHITEWEKIAIVTDVNWIQQAGKIFGFAIETMSVPGDVKIFHNSELDDAIKWISEEW